MTTLTFKNATEALPHLLDHVMDKGHDTPSRNGLCREVIMQQVTLTEPFPFEITTPGRNGSLPAQIAETMWLLAGRNDVAWLANYLPRAAEFSDDGETWAGGYGPRLRAWDKEKGWPGTDQLAHVVQLLKDDPTTRRAVMQIYDPEKDTFNADAGRKDIPCNNWLHFLPRDGKLHAHVAIRSNDLMWGWSGINHFEWAALQHIIAGLVGMEQGSLTFSISSLHLYEPHWDKAKRIVRGSKHVEAPKFGIANDVFDAAAAGHSVTGLDALVTGWFQVEALIRENGPSKQVEYEIDRFPEVMMRQWLKVLYSWWHGQNSYPKYFQGSSLGAALASSPKRKQPAPLQPTPDVGAFTVFADNLHREKNAAYGDSWKRRGEMLGIMANCARKVDRLGVGGAGDTAADTAIDLMMYLIKYDLWLDNLRRPEWDIVDGDGHVNAVTNYLQVLAEGKLLAVSGANAIRDIKLGFDLLETQVTEKDLSRGATVKILIGQAHTLAVRLWNAEKPVAHLDELQQKIHGIGAAALAARSNDTRRWNPEA